MRCPSAKSVSKANEDLPEPDTPVITTSLFLGMATLRFFRLFTRALLMMMLSRGSRSSIGKWEMVRESGFMQPKFSHFYPQNRPGKGFDIFFCVKDNIFSGNKYIELHIG